MYLDQPCCSGNDNIDDLHAFVCCRKWRDGVEQLNTCAKIKNIYIYIYVPTSECRSIVFVVQAQTPVDTCV